MAEAALGISPGFFAVEAGVRDELLISLLRRALLLLGSEQHPLRSMVLARLAMAVFWTDAQGESTRLSREAWELVETTKNSNLRLHLLMARWLAEWTPYNAMERAAIADEAIELARLGSDQEILIIALLYCLVCSLEAGDINRFDRMRDEFRRLANELKQPQAIWYSKLIDATRDLHSGNFTRAEERARSYFEVGRRIGDVNAYHSVMAQSLAHASERGDTPELLRISEEGCAKYPVFVGWRASRCWALARAGRSEAAEHAFDEIIASGITGVPRKLDWPVAVAVLAEAAFLLERVDVAEELYGLLLPMRGNLLVLGFCVMTWGPVARYLGLLSELLGRLRDAAQWYEQAIEEGRKSAGEPWVAHAGFGLYRVERGMGRDRQAVRQVAEHSFAIARRLGMSDLEKSVARALGK